MNQEKKITKQIIFNLKKGEDLQALSILRENDKFLCLRSIKKICNQIFCKNKKYHYECDYYFDNHNTFYFLMHISHHRHDLNIDINHDNLIDACRHGRLEIVKILLNNVHVDPSYRDNETLIIANAYGHIEIVKIFLDDERIILSNKLCNDMIKVASERGYVELVKLMISRHEIKDLSNNCSIAIACKEKHWLIVELLLNDSRFDPSIKVSSDMYGSALNYAIVNNNIDIVKKLLDDERVDPSENVNNPIQKACLGGSVEIVKLILEHKKFNPNEYLFCEDHCLGDMLCYDDIYLISEGVKSILCEHGLA